MEAGFMCTVPKPDISEDGDAYEPLKCPFFFFEPRTDMRYKIQKLVLNSYQSIHATKKTD